MTVLQSMLMLKVMDYDKLSHTEDIGFLELSLADIPWEKDIRGWFELRFCEKLERTSHERYAAHCSTRDDENDSGDRAEAPEEALEESGSILSSLSCSACHAKPPQLQRNAGELLVQLRLVRTGSRLDTAFALALEPPAPHYFSVRVKQEELGIFNVQELGDDIHDIKIAVVDNAVICTTNLIGYVLQWRSALLSGSILLAALLVQIFPVLTWVVIPAAAASVFMLLGCEGARREMTTGGSNAPFTQDGFERAARWMSTPVMARYLRRVVEGQLQGRVLDEAAFRACAARCFSNGKPRISYDDLCEALQQVSWVSTSSTGGFAPGSLVLVEGARRARVLTVQGDRVAVRYSDGAEGSVASAQLAPRLDLSLLPAWAFPHSIEQHLRRLELGVNHAKVGLLGVLEAAALVITWRSRCAALLITLALWAWAALQTCNVLYLRFFPEHHLAAAIRRGIQEAAHYGAIACVILLLTHQSRWFVPVRSAARICWRLLTIRRHAPKNWPFFRAG